MIPSQDDSWRITRRGGDREQTGYDQVRDDEEEQSVYAEEVDDEEYWSQDSQFSHLDIEETEVEGDLVEEDELFCDASHDNLIDVVNNNINQSCRRVTGKGKAKLIDVDDLDVRVGEELDVNSDEQYKRVWDYVFSIRKYNPGSSAYVKVDRIDRPPPIFQRMYICMAACKEGFLKGCRPLLGVDGCHLKGMYPGMCLAAVAMDGNNNIFPVAWGVVEVENGETWEWFLDFLNRDIGSDEGDGLTFMSDRQKGLIDALNVVVPRAEIRYCVRHILANFKLQFTGQAFEDSFWRAAWATTETAEQVEFKAELEEIKKLSDAAYNYVIKKPPRNWSRHAFSTNCKSSMILNNLCETFNSVLKDARDKPILTHMEWMRRYVMKRNFEKREGVDMYEGRYMPYIHKCFKSLIIESRNAKVHASMSTDFEVDYKGETFIVNLVEQKCICFHWQLTGIPCVHAMACILDQRLIP